MPSTVEQIVQLELAIAAQESLRSVLGSAVDTVIDALHTQVESLRARDGLPGEPHALDQHLSLLSAVELIRLLEIFPERTYIFKHTLIQEAAYQSLLRHERMLIHRQVADCYTRLYAEHLTEVAPLLAFHYTEAGDDTQALEHSLVAAESAARRFAYPEASLHYARAIDAFTRLPNTPAVRARRIESITRYVELAWGTILPSDQLVLLAEAESLALSLSETGDGGTVRRLARIHSMMAAMHLAANDLQQADSLAREVLAQAGALGDDTLAITPSAQRGALLVLQGHFAEAMPHLSRALGLLAGDFDRWEWAWSLGFHAISLAMLGYVEQGFAEVEGILARVEAGGNHVGMMQGRSYLLAVCLAAGDSDRLLAESRLAVAVATQHESALYTTVALYYQALALSRLGQHGEARQRTLDAYSLTQHIGDHFMQSDWLAAAQSEIAFNGGQYVEAVGLAKQAIALALGSGSDFARGWAERILGATLLSLDRTHRAQAEAHFAESVRLLEACGAQPEVRRTHAVWSKMLRRLGEDEAAHVQISAAQEQTSSWSLNFCDPSCDTEKEPAGSVLSKPQADLLV